MELIGGIEKRDIEIFDYDPRWRDEFEAHAERIADALGAAALRIEHVGSTSVPGLAAKPIIRRKSSDTWSFATGCGTTSTIGRLMKR
jgi:hypothetical protein